MSATAELWRRRAPRTPAVPSAAVLLGRGLETLTDALALSLASSPEATRLLDSMELLTRTLKSTISEVPERCISSVRGPVRWAETITARANALGNDDVFVCATSQRSFDTVENRVLVAALDSVARASRALKGPMGSMLSESHARRVAETADEAHRWRQHRRLAGIRASRVTGRDLARLRGGHRVARLAPVLAVTGRVAEPFGPDDVARLADERTAAYHGFVATVHDVLVERGLAPPAFRLSDGGLWSGALSFRHPAAGPHGAIGLVYRGIPLLPPTDVVDGARWADRLPSRGLTVGDRDDVHRVLDRIAAREQARQRGAVATS